MKVVGLTPNHLAVPKTLLHAQISVEVDNDAEKKLGSDNMPLYTPPSPPLPSVVFLLGLLY